MSYKYLLAIVLNHCLYFIVIFNLIQHTAYSRFTKDQIHFCSWWINDIKLQKHFDLSKQRGKKSINAVC